MASAPASFASIAIEPVVGMSAVGWTIAVTVAVIVYLVLVAVAFSLMFRRTGLGTGAKIFWAWLVLFLPYLGAIISIMVDVARRRAKTT